MSSRFLVVLSHPAEFPEDHGKEPAASLDAACDFAARLRRDWPLAGLIVEIYEHAALIARWVYGGGAWQAQRRRVLAGRKGGRHV